MSRRRCIPNVVNFTVDAKNDDIPKFHKKMPNQDVIKSFFLNDWYFTGWDITQFNVCSMHGLFFFLFFMVP